VALVGVDHPGTLLAGWHHHLKTHQVIAGQTHAAGEPADPTAQGDATDAGGPLSSAGDGVAPLSQCLYHRPLGGAGLHGGHPRALVNVDPVHIADVDDHPTIHGGPTLQGMPAAAGAKGDIVLSAPTESINHILDVLTKDDYEGEFGELSGPTQTSALIVRTIGKDQTSREFTPRGSDLILHV
jgi:hypothetical protein